MFPAILVFKVPVRVVLLNTTLSVVRMPESQGFHPNRVRHESCRTLIGSLEARNTITPPVTFTTHNVREMG